MRLLRCLSVVCASGLALLWLSVLLGCGQAPQVELTGGPAVAPAAIVLDEDDAGRTLTVAENQTVEIHLRGNPTTGYRWVLAALAGDSVAPVGDVTYQADEAGGRVGAGGTFTATFKAAEVGEADLTLQYKRPWEKAKPSLKTFTVRAIVTSPTAQ